MNDDEAACMSTEAFFRWTAWLLIAAIAVFTLLPLEPHPIVRGGAHLERFAAFAAAGGAFGLGYPKHRARIALLILVVAGILEIGQGFVPGRHGRTLDGVVKASGALAGCAATMLFASRRRAS